MSERAHQAGGRSSPGLRYRNVGAAVAWLCNAFGFGVRTKATDDNGAVVYAELSFGPTIIMVGGVSGFDTDRYMKQPDDIGGAETQCCYYAVEDIDAIYVRARRAGAHMVVDLSTRADGARSFTCRDLEGHLWCFGTYDPYANDDKSSGNREAGDTALAARMDMRALADAAGPAAAPERHTRVAGRLAGALSLAFLVSGPIAAWIYAEAWQTSRTAAAGPTTATAIGPERMIAPELEGEMFQQAIKDVRRRLVAERRSRRAAEQELELAREEAEHERSLRISAQETARMLTEQLELAHETVARAQKAAGIAQTNLIAQRMVPPAERERFARELKDAKRAAAAAREQLAAAQEAAADAEHRRKAAVAARDRAERGRKDAVEAKEVAEVARSQAEAEAKEARERLTFVSVDGKEHSAQAITELQKQIEREKAARAAAEQDAKTARDELERERQLKAAAWRTVVKLRSKIVELSSSPNTATIIKPADEPGEMPSIPERSQPAEGAAPPETSSTGTGGAPGGSD